MKTLLFFLSCLFTVFTFPQEIQSKECDNLLHYQRGLDGNGNPKLHHGELVYYDINNDGDGVVDTEEVVEIPELNFHEFSTFNFQGGDVGADIKEPSYIRIPSGDKLPNGLSLAGLFISLCLIAISGILLCSRKTEKGIDEDR